MGSETPHIKIAPSLLSADFSRLAEDVRRVEKAGCDLLHVDVMDGHFVPNITVGPLVVKAVRKVTALPLDVHLMIEAPWKYVQAFAEAGADHITVHAEACGPRLKETLAQIRAEGPTCGISLSPATEPDGVLGLLDEVTMVLLMTVNPGFGGQAFISEVMPKVARIRSLFGGDVEVDGGINLETAKTVVASGANVLVAGTAVFGSPDAGEAVRRLKCAAEVR